MKSLCSNPPSKNHSVHRFSVFVAVRFLFFLFFISPCFAQQKEPVYSEEWKKKLIPVPLNISRKKSELEFPGEIKIFYTLPNAISTRFYGHKSLEANGFLSDTQQSKFNHNQFSLFRSWSISNLHYPKTWWSWGIRFSPSLSLYRWKRPGNVILLHLLYSAKAILNLPSAYGTIFGAIGLGPMYINGNVNNLHTNRHVIISPRLQLGLYKFINKRLFVQIKYNKYHIWGSPFEKGLYSIEHFDIVGLYFGVFFAKE